MLNPIDTTPFDKLIGVYGTIKNETNSDLGNHYCFGCAKPIYTRHRRNFKTKIRFRNKKIISRKCGFEFLVSPTYFYPLTCDNIIGWFDPPEI